MLPGFRFLFAAIMLSMSLLVFGLGAAALLRAAHESFASDSSWRGAPEVTFAQRNDATLPMLATLSVDSATEKANDPAKVAAAPVEPAPSPAEPSGGDQLAASSPAETPSAEIAKPDSASAGLPAAQDPPAPEAAPAIAEAATTSETKTAAVAVPDASSDNSEPAIAQPQSAVPQPTNAATATSEATAAPTSAPEASAASTKIATLGGPPVEITDAASASETPAPKSDRAKPDQAAINKRAEAKRAVRRRELAARARLAAQLQLQAYPFGQPQQLVPAAPRR
jgi:hypothetical protein